MRKSILIVNNNLQIGGVQRSLVNLIQEIKNDYDITLYLFNMSGQLLEDINSDVRIIQSSSILRILGMSFQEVKNTKKVSYIISKILFSFLARVFGNKHAIKLIIRFEPKLCNFDYAISYMQPSPNHRFYGGTNEFVLERVDAISKLSFVHCDYKNYGGDLDYAVSLYKQFDAVAFCSEGCLNSFESLTTLITEKSYVVRNCHNYKKVRELSISSSVMYDRNFYNIVIVSRLSEEKGIDISIKAIQKCVTTYNLKIKLHVVGSGKELSEYKGLVHSLGLSGNVIFYGDQQNPYRYMKNADLLLLTSRHEAAPMVFTEANILNLPILATETTSTKEFIIDKGAGWVSHNSVDDIARSINNISTGIWSIKNSGHKYKPFLNNSSAIKEFKICLRGCNVSS